METGAFPLIGIVGYSQSSKQKLIQEIIDKELNHKGVVIIQSKSECERLQAAGGIVWRIVESNMRPPKQELDVIPFIPFDIVIYIPRSHEELRQAVANAVNKSLETKSVI